MSKQRRGTEKKTTQLQRAVIGHVDAARTDTGLPILPSRIDRLLTALSSMNAWVCEFDENVQLLYCSPQVEQIIGYTAEECMVEDRIQMHEDDLPEAATIGQRVRTSGEAARTEVRVRHALGHWVWVEITLLGWHEEEGGEFRSITVARDLSALKDARAAQLASEERYRVVSEMSGDLIFELDLEGQIQYVGPGTDALIGFSRSDTITLTPWSLIHPDDLERVKSEVSAEFERGIEQEALGRAVRPPSIVESRVRHRDGRWLWFESQGLTYRNDKGELRYICVCRDVTERKEAEQTRRELEERMQQAQRLDSLGVLAGGIAHDFNNLLTPILGRAGLALRELPEGSPLHAHLDAIQQSAERAAALTNQMLAYAGQRPLRVQPLDVSKQVEAMRELIIASISGQATLDIRLEPNLPAVDAEAAQLGQVIMNLVTNAAESLGDGDSRIFVRTGQIELDRPPEGALFSESMVPGRYVYFEVRDTGTGMDEETRGRIFDPFFTTKFAGRGLGLAAVAGIVRGHRGALQVETAPGRGTRFRVLLPSVDRPHAEAISKHGRIDDWRAQGTVLVIDDDAGVCDLAREVLQRTGMKVLTAMDGHEGLKLFEQHERDIRVVLLDRTMPSLSGAETFDAIRNIKPSARIVLVSGYSEERVSAELAGRGLAGFLQKPFLPDTLLWRVREAIEAD